MSVTIRVVRSDQPTQVVESFSFQDVGTATAFRDGWMAAARLTQPGAVPGANGVQLQSNVELRPGDWGVGSS